MTVQKLAAGSGYEYLTKQVAALDSTKKRNVPLADYYSAKGESPERWVGSELTGIDGLEPDDIVAAEQTKHLFGSSCHPVSGQPLSVRRTRPTPTYAAIVARQGASPTSGCPRWRTQS